MSQGAKNLFIYAIGAFAAPFFDLLYSIVFSRVNSATEVGRYSTYMGLIVFAVIALQAWFATPLLRYYPGASIEERQSFRGLAVGYLSWLSLLVPVVTIAAWAFVSACAAETLFLVLANSVTSIAYAILVYFMVASGRGSGYAMAQVAIGVLKLVAGLVLVRVWHNSAEAVVWGALLGRVPLLVWIWRDLRLPAPRLPLASGTPFLAQILRFGLPLSLAQVAQQLPVTWDRFFVRACSGVAACGVYTSLAVVCQGLVAAMVSALLFSINHRIVLSWNAGAKLEVRTLMQRVVRGYLLFSSLFLLVLWYWCGEIAQLIYHDAPSWSGRALWVLTLGAVVGQLVVILQKNFELAGCTRFILYSALFGLVVDIATVAWLSRNYGPAGSAAALVVTQGCQLLATVFLWRRIWRCHGGEKCPRSTTPGPAAIIR